WVLIASIISIAACDAQPAGRCVAGKVILPGTPVPDGGGHVHPTIPIPPEYQDVVNPYGYDDPSKAVLGQPIYAARCARCHGDDGRGCGPEAARYDPPPDDLWTANQLHV